MANRLEPAVVDEDNDLNRDDLNSDFRSQAAPFKIQEMEVHNRIHFLNIF